LIPPQPKASDIIKSLDKDALKVLRSLVSPGREEAAEKAAAKP
jgi:hypothetical protein